MNTRTRCLLFLFCSALLFSPEVRAQSLGDNPPGQNPFARVQFIHSMIDIGPVDIYLDDTLWLDDFDYRAATAFEHIPNGSYKVDLVFGADTSNAQPLWSGLLTLLTEERYVFAALGQQGEIRVILRQNVRAEPVTGLAEFFVIHGAPDTGPLDLRLRDPSKSNAVVSLVYNNITFGTAGIYANLFPAEYNFEVTTADNRHVIDVYHFNLSNYAEEPLVFIASGTGNSTGEGFALIGYDHDGNAIFPQITTATEDAAVPEAFTLEQNYPNPFNPATQIQYALSQAADVRLTVYDLLGRTVQTLVETHQPPGSYTARWDGRNDAAASVPSGVYLYRLEANDVVKTRRMLLVK